MAAKKVVKKVKLGKRVILGYTEVAVRTSIGTLTDSEGNFLYGLFDHGNKIITLNAGNKPHDQARTLYHEIVHAAKSILTGGSGDHDANATEEITCRASEFALVELLKNPKNRWVMQFIAQNL